LDDLRGDYQHALSEIAELRSKSRTDQAARWLADAFDRWQESGGGLYTICTAKQFEEQVGTLSARRRMDVPPYAELLIQGWSGLAFRHPEYMLARDLSCLYTLYCDSAVLLHGVNWREPPDWARGGSENIQTLARAVIQSCFNLVESFVCGLGRAHEMNHPGLDQSMREKLLNTRSPLKRRIVQVPELIAGRIAGLDGGSDPLASLFDGIKKRRDAFVHCEPGSHESRGYVKEAAFHDVAEETVNDAVDRTIVVIRLIWQCVHGRDGPSWLPATREDLRSKEQMRLSSRVGS